VSALDSVRLHGDLATVGAGTTLARLVAHLGQSNRAVPAGTCPSVGVSGLTLGGGWGLLGRMYGLTCDHLVQAEVVLADGRVVMADSEREPELLWALRGAGAGGFGVVTSLVFKTRAAPTMTCFHHVWPLEHAVAAVVGWLAWAVDTSDRMTASLVLSAPDDPRMTPTVQIHGAMVGTACEAAALLGELCGHIGGAPDEARLIELSYVEAAGFHASRLEAVDGTWHRFSSSEFLVQTLPEDAVKTLVSYVVSGRVPGESREVELMPWAGAFGVQQRDAAAFPHRYARYSVEHTASVRAGRPPRLMRAANAWTRRMRALTSPWGTGGVYANFADIELEDWPTAYYGANLARLIKARARYDPDNVFAAPQSI
jgi:FAD/FMN-containing dehydrogenase